MRGMLRAFHWLRPTSRVWRWVLGVAIAAILLAYSFAFLTGEALRRSVERDVDHGPFKPLHLSRLNVTAENIRNIRSKDRVYPSDGHVESVVFGSGRLWLRGQADFLAEPHPGLLARFQLDRIELDYFKPLANRANLSVRNGTLTAP